MLYIYFYTCLLEKYYFYADKERSTHTSLDYNCDNDRKFELLLIFLGRSGESQTRCFVIAKTPNDLNEEK